MSNFHEERLSSDLGFETLTEAREYFYPDYWMFATTTDTADPATAPGYVIVPRSESERELAYRVRPEGIVADIRPVEAAN